MNRTKKKRSPSTTMTRDYENPYALVLVEIKTLNSVHIEATETYKIQNKNSYRNCRRAKYRLEIASIWVVENTTPFKRLTPYIFFSLSFFLLVSTADVVCCYRYISLSSNPFFISFSFTYDPAFFIRLLLIKHIFFGWSNRIIPFRTCSNHWIFNRLRSTDLLFLPWSFFGK